MTELSEIEARVLGCLMEKKETTPDQYPLTLNSLKLACNQKTARVPVTSYTEGEVGHAVRELINRNLAREAWGARVAKYEHQAGKVLGLQSKALALLCVLILRGPQTLGELKTHAHRLFEFDDLDDVAYVLGRMAENEPPLTQQLPRQPGQKEERYVHLLCGEPDLDSLPVAHSPAVTRHDQSERIEELEKSIEALTRRVTWLESQTGFADQTDRATIDHSGMGNDLDDSDA